jgi:hypothetical protein
MLIHFLATDILRSCLAVQALDYDCACSLACMLVTRCIVNIELVGSTVLFQGVSGVGLSYDSTQHSTHHNNQHCYCLAMVHED